MLEAGGVPQKLDFLIALIASGAWTRFAVLLTFFTIGIVIAAIVCGVWVSDRASIRHPSFVLLTAKAIEAKSIYKKRVQKGWWVLGGSIVGTLLLGVVSNFVFYLCMAWWGL
jgi:hypothetical protein